MNFSVIARPSPRPAPEMTMRRLLISLAGTKLGPGAIRVNDTIQLTGSTLAPRSWDSTSVQNRKCQDLHVTIPSDHCLHTATCPVFRPTQPAIPGDTATVQASQNAS